MKKQEQQSPVCDRRVIRTKRRLTHSLKELIVEKGFNGFTVQEVLKRAGVGRSTFYSHFESIEHLLPCEENFRIMLTADVSPGAAFPLNFRALYEEALGNLPLTHELMKGEGGRVVMEHLRNILSVLLREHFNINIRPDTDAERLLAMMCDAAAAALVGLLMGWHAQGMSFSPDYMEGKSQELLQSFFSTGLQKGV